MSKKICCLLCGRKDFSSVSSLVEHIKNSHMGKLSDKSVEYLLSIGVKPDAIIEYCKSERIKVDKSKVFKIALRLVRSKPTPVPKDKCSKIEQKTLLFFSQL